MRYRKLSPTGDYVFGNGQADFWRDVPDAVAQAAYTRLQLWLGQWFLNTADGTPYQTQVLGKYTGSTRDAAIRARILGTQGLTSIDAYASQVDRDTRAFSVQATVTTTYSASQIRVQVEGLKPPPPSQLFWDDPSLNWDDPQLSWPS